MSAPAEAAAAAVAMELGGTRRVMNPTQSPIESFLLVLFQFSCVWSYRVCTTGKTRGYVHLLFF